MLSLHLDGQVRKALRVTAAELRLPGPKFYRKIQGRNE